MGVQNFVEGGFYGKVGQLIGQRWRNIRIVRAYTKPTDPKTAKQQANRRVFAEATQNAQLSLMLNWKSPIFNSESNTGWGLRMASARANQKAGKSGFNLVPVLPVDFVPTYTGNKITLQSSTPGHSATFTLEGTLPNVTREIMVLCGVKASASAEYTISIFSSQLVPGSPSTFTLAETHPELFNEFTKMLIISNDDNETDKATVYTPETFLSTSAPVVRDFDTTINSVIRTGQTFRVVLAEPYITATTSLSGVSVHAISNGEWVYENIVSPTLVNENGFFAIEFSQGGVYSAETWAFASGSSVSIASISAINSQYTLTKNNAVESAHSTDLTRPLATGVEACAIEDDYFKIKLTQGFHADSVFSQNGLVVQNQSYVEAGGMGSYFSFADSEDDKLVLCCENENDADSWVAVPGSAIVATLLSVTVNGVTYSAQNVNIPYTFIQGSATFEDVAPLAGNQSIHQPMIVKVPVGAQMSAIYGSLSTADFLARCTRTAIGGYIYKDDVGHEGDEMDDYSLVGFEDGCLKFSLPACNDSDFVGHLVYYTLEAEVYDSVLDYNIYVNLEEIWTNRTYTN